MTSTPADTPAASSSRRLRSLLLRMSTAAHLLEAAPQAAFGMHAVYRQSC